MNFVFLIRYHLFHLRHLMYRPMLSIEGHTQHLHNSMTDTRARRNSAIIDCPAARPKCVLTMRTIAMPHAGAASHRELLRRETGKQIKER